MWETFEEFETVLLVFWIDGSPLMICSFWFTVALVLLIIFPSIFTTFNLYVVGINISKKVSSNFAQF